MSSSIAKDEKIGNISLSINAVTGKKAKLASVSLSFGDNRYSPILSTLLWIYSQEKIVPGFMNGNVFQYNAIAGHNSITFTCPDVKIFAVIQQVYLYLLKLKIPANIARTIVYEDDSRANFYKRLQQIKVVIVGACKSTCAKITSDDKKYDAFKQSLQDLYSKYKDLSNFDAVQAKSATINSVTINVTKPGGSSDLLRLYLAVILGDLPCSIKFSGPNSAVIKFIDPCANHWCNLLKNYVQARIKAFLNQFGVVGSEPSDASKKKRYDEKVKITMESLNTAAAIVCIQHGLAPIKFTKVDEIRGVDAETIVALKSIH